MSSLKAYLIFLTVVTLSSPLGKETANCVNTSLRPHYLNRLRRCICRFNLVDIARLLEPPP